MDKAAAERALRAAEIAADKTRHRNNTGGVVFLSLGAALAILVAVLGAPSIGIAPAGTAISLVVSLLPLLAAVMYSAIRSAKPRYSRTVNVALLGAAAVLVSVTLTVGHAVFKESNEWWVGGALISAAPLILIGVVELRHQGGNGVRR